MGFTPLAGVPMGTRSGDVDPAVVLFLMEKEGISIGEINGILNKNSGVYGISGVSSDFRDLSDAAKSGNKRAELAEKMFAYNVKKYVGEYDAVVGGADAIVFTAGIGENNPVMRQAIIEGLEGLGMMIDPVKNDAARGEADISADGAEVKIFVIPTNEELMIAKETLELL